MPTHTLCVPAWCGAVRTGDPDLLPALTAAELHTSA